MMYWRDAFQNLGLFQNVIDILNHKSSPDRSGESLTRGYSYAGSRNARSWRRWPFTASSSEAKFGKRLVEAAEAERFSHIPSTGRRAVGRLRVAGRAFGASRLPHQVARDHPRGRPSPARAGRRSGDRRATRFCRPCRPALACRGRSRRNNQSGPRDTSTPHSSHNVGHDHLRPRGVPSQETPPPR